MVADDVLFVNENFYDMIDRPQVNNSVEQRQIQSLLNQLRPEEDRSISVFQKNCLFPITNG